MDIKEAMNLRHSVRSFTDREIDDNAETTLDSVISECNKEGDLHIQLILDEPEAFSGMMAHYGKFNNCRNYIAIAGKKNKDLEVGYYGEKVVLTAQSLGINSCWVAMTYSKSKVPCLLNDKEKLLIVIALGYGVTQGVQHRNKPMESLCKVDGDMPEWFRKGMEASMLAPTATNQQKFCFTLKGNKVKATAGIGFYSKIDLGIVKYHFELGAGSDNFTWE